MRAFHFAWFGFFMAFVSWFAFAPLMKEIKGDLGMTKLEVYNANISSVASTILSRFVVGPLCDTFGARISSSVLLLMGCIPTAFGGLVNSAVDVAVIRFFIGVMGATFVCTQFWTSQVFAKEFVGTANATSAGWGNLGGGVTQVRSISCGRTAGGGLQVQSGVLSCPLPPCHVDYSQGCLDVSSCLNKAIDCAGDTTLVLVVNLSAHAFVVW